MQSQANHKHDGNQFSQTMHELSMHLLVKQEGGKPDHLSKEALELARWFAKPDAPSITKIHRVREMYQRFSHQTKPGVTLREFALSIKKIYDEGHPHGIFVYRDFVEEGLVVVVEQFQIDSRPYSELVM